MRRGWFRTIVGGCALLLAVAASADAQSMPDDTRFVASSRGRVYYWVGCSAWRSLSAANLRYFRTRAAAEQIGLVPSRSPGCAGPNASAADSAAPPSARAASGSLVCVVSRVVDGDTVHCLGGRKVRLLLIDAPERNQGSFGAIATAVLERHAPVGTRLSLELDVQHTDRYGRTLAYARTPDGRMLNEELVRAGVAVVSVYPPNVRHVERLRAIADSARLQRRGLWSGSAFDCLPADHRARRCR